MYDVGDVYLFFISSDYCGNRGRAPLRRFGPGSCPGYVGVGTVKGKPAFSRRAYPRSSGHQRQCLGEPVLLNVRTAQYRGSGIVVRSIIYFCCTAASLALLY